jgi:TPR repeat protein
VPTSITADLREAAQSISPGEFLPANRLRLIAAPADTFSVEGVTAAPGSAVDIKIRIPDQAGDDASAKSTRRFLMFRGLPEGFTLSAGFRTRNTWIVAINDVSGLKLNIPPHHRGSVSVEVLLYRGEAERPSVQIMSVQIAHPPADARTAATPEKDTGGEPPADSAVKAQSRPSTAPSKEEEELLRQAANHLRDGNIVFARVLFEEAAARGSAQGAFAMAQTYDSTVLEQLRVVGIQGDLEKAKYWYRKAAELGNIPTVDILSSLKKERPQE